MKDLFDFDTDILELPALSTGGEDTIKMSAWVDWAGCDIRAIYEELDRLKRKAQGLSHSDEAEDEPEQFATMSYSYTVKPVSINPGKSKYTHYPFFLMDGGIGLGISFRDVSKKGAKPNVRIEIGSLPLMCSRSEDVLDDIAYRIQQMGGRIERLKMSRVDVCVDLPGIAVDRFVEAFDEGAIICQARNRKNFHVFDCSDSECIEVSVYAQGSHKTGISIGARPFVFRAYDKLRECAYREDKLLALQEFRYGKMPEVATRVEFQLSCEALTSLTVMGKAMSIDSPEDWFKCRADIIEYLTTYWLRFIGKDYDRHNSNRMTEDKLLPEWRSVIEAFRKWASRATSKAQRIIKPVRMRCVAYMQQLLGLLAACFVASGHDQHFHTPRELRAQFLRYGWEAIKCMISTKEDLKHLFQTIRRARFRREEKTPKDYFLPWLSFAF